MSGLMDNFNGNPTNHCPIHGCYFPINELCPQCFGARQQQAEIERVRGDFKPDPWLESVDYYSAPDGTDIRNVIEAFNLNFNEGAAAKYIFRRKPGNERKMDIRKAIVQLQRELARLDKLV